LNEWQRQLKAQATIALDMTNDDCRERAEIRGGGDAAAEPTSRRHAVHDGA
jgi:hypothetical protein